MKNKQNVLDFVPVRKIENFSTDDSGVITLEIENKGVFNCIAQKLFKKPKITYTNQPNIGYIWEVLLNLLSQQEGWDTEFKVTATLKDECN